MTGTITIDPTEWAPSDGVARSPGAAIEVRNVSQHAGGRQVLHDVSLSIRPGELVAVVGASGSGKSTLLETMAGLRRPSAGSVTHGGRPPASGVTRVGFVPQDDIVHRELPLRRTLRYAARLRLPAATSAAEIETIVDETLRDLDLAERGDVRVGSLSGGQRKRASVAVELLTRPGVFFLDEPTSGLDPATAAEVLVVLRRLAQGGVTVVVTTHNLADVDVCDRVVFLAREGRVSFAGTPLAARKYFGVTDLAQVYRRPAEDTPTRTWVGTAPPPALSPVPDGGPGRPVGWFRQWAVLTTRNADVVVRNPLTLAVLAGSPALVTAMMAVLFRPGQFRATGPGALGPAQTVFWVAFAGFFFGLTYGLLQIVGERAVFRRERFAGLRPSAYVASKVALLLPLLAGVAVVLLGVLRGLDRLPAAGWDTYSVLFVTLVVESLCALTLGLLASAAVADATQATLALPMLCFPQVLFAGAVVPVDGMAAPGRVISAAMANRWAFESLGRALRLDTLTADTPAMAAYHDAMAGSAVTGWVVLAAFSAVFAAATVVLLRRGART